MSGQDRGVRGGGDEPLDDLTVEAVGILVEAVREAVTPGVPERRVIEGALERAVTHRSALDLDHAGMVFDRLDGATREAVADRAAGKARARRRLRRSKRGALLVAAAGRTQRPE